MPPNIHYIQRSMSAKDIHQPHLTHWSRSTKCVCLLPIPRTFVHCTCTLLVGLKHGVVKVHSWIRTLLYSKVSHCALICTSTVHQGGKKTEMISKCHHNFKIPQVSFVKKSYMYEKPLIVQSVRHTPQASTRKVTDRHTCTDKQLTMTTLVYVRMEH